MLTLTKKVDYSVIALCHLALHRDRVATAREIAQRYNLPLPLLMNVLKALAGCGIVRSSRGAKGGYELAKPADQVTLCGLVEAVEGPIRFAQCAGDHEEPAAVCNMVQCGCPIASPIRRLHEKLKSFLEDITLADIAHDPDYGLPLQVRGLALSLNETETTT